MRSPDAGVGGRGHLKSDMNVAPLVGVLFVLLVNMIFLVRFDSGHGADVLLPRAAFTVDKPNPELYELTVVVIAADRRLFVNGYPVREEEFTQKVTEALGSKKDKTVLIKGDEEVPYSAIMAVMDRLHVAHIESVCLVVEKRVNRPGGLESGR